MATAATNGGGGWVQWLHARERTEEGDELEGVSERDQGAAWRLQASLEGAGEAGGGRGSRRWPRQHRRPSATRAAYWRGEDDRGGTPGGLGHTGGLPAQELGQLLAPGGALGGLQVGGPGRLLLFFYISVLFSFI